MSFTASSPYRSLRSIAIINIPKLSIKEIYRFALYTSLFFQLSINRSLSKIKSRPDSRIVPIIPPVSDPAI
jgi:hypothetical protein